MREWTKDEIKTKVQENQAWLERAILALFEKQTEEEKRAEQTKIVNFKGFNGPDARRMTYYAKWIKSGKHLSDRFLLDAQKRVLKYCSQLTKIANQQI
jgi:hypothetical protein